MYVCMYVYIPPHHCPRAYFGCGEDGDYDYVHMVIILDHTGGDFG